MAKVWHKRNAANPSRAMNQRCETKNGPIQNEWGWLQTDVANKRGTGPRLRRIPCRHRELELHKVQERQNQVRASVRSGGQGKSKVREIRNQRR